ncbi:phage tail tape measure protein [Bradyrhizobium ottawaense]|uniref:Phage tail tape measure protein, TP901 family, core region n=1 Tax=Bradyrhizobium ottawaense TaxID=931866 RepID=A0ABY0QH33_9BRAD|nr:phage tail tape measure protein [Bradyrhizobium ottawaense]SDK39863.1 phage tail tape measure protein, TP901 family, core region [Bradyrhizobium ottawaense]
MSDNNLDIRARLTGEDRMSSTIVKLLAKIKSLETQMQRLGKAGNSISDIPMEKYVKQLNAGQKAVNGLTKKHLDWAKANGVAGDQAQLSWGKLTNELIRAGKEHEKWTQSTARGAKKRAQLAAEELQQHYKNAVAFKYLYNRVGEQRMDSQRRVTEQLGNLEAAHLRNQERLHRNHLTNISRMRQAAMRSMSQLSGIGSRSGMYAAAGAAASGYAGVSAFRTRMRTDTAETNLKMFGEMNDAQVREMRKSWGNASSIKYGMTADKMIDAFTEVLKAGVPKDKAREVTDTLMKSGTGLDLDLKETTRFATRIATLTQDMNNLDPAKLKSILNAVAVAGMESAADPNEIIAANRRASGVFATSKMTPEDLSAFTGTGVGIGLPSAKVGTFLGFIVNELVGSKNARGQRGKDLSTASNMLGLGGRNQMSAQMAANPADTLLKIFDKVGSMDEQRQNKVLNLLGMREWRDELAAFVEAKGNLADLLAKVRDRKNAGKLDEINDKKLKSLAGRWRSFVSAMTLLWESVGAGFEKAFGQITDFFTNYFGTLDTGKIRESVEAFTDGIVAGMGFASWSDMLKAAFGDPAEVKSHAKQIFDFTKGFVAEIKKAAEIVGGIISSIATKFGVKDAESAGKFTAQILELVAALKALGTVAGYLESLVTFVKSIAGIMTMVGFAANDVGIPDAHIRRKGESMKDFRERESTTKRLQNYTTPKGADPLFTPTSYTGSTDFSGRRRSKVDDLASQLGKFGGNVERAAFMSGNLGNGGLQYAMSGGSGRGLSLGGGSASGGGGSGFIGGVPALLKATPGQALPGLGALGSSGIIQRGVTGNPFSDATMAAKDKAWLSRGSSGNSSIVDPQKVPSFTGGGGSAADNVGAGLSGDAFLQARRARFGEELKNDPNLALHLAAMQQTEGASRGGTIESLMNRADMQGKSMRQMLGFSAEGVRSTDGRGRQNSFYGPVRRGEIYGAIRNMQNNPKEFAKYNAFTQKALAGSHVIGGHTDQGLPTDPNGSARTGIPGLRLRDPRTGKLDGNEFTDWVGPGSKYGRGRAGAINYRKLMEQGIAGSGDAPLTSAVPSPADAVQNVPSPIRGDASLGLNGGGGGGGPVAIHINGSSHDPEALATLVQRRIDESMNWRTHDTASEYT